MDINHRTIDELSNTDYIMNNTFFIGTYPGMTKDKIDYIIDTFESFFSDLKD
jgi:CDP-6-deoxy-D-xylo-4-hexulose-3-dehydrase